MRVLLIKRHAFHDELVVALQLISHSVSMTVYFKVYIKLDCFMIGLRGLFSVNLSHRSLRLKKSVLREQFPLKEIFDC